MSPTVLEVADLGIEYGQAGHASDAVVGVDLVIGPHESVGLIGDSGSGKSTIIKAVLGLLPRTARVTGDVRFRGTSILGDGAASTLRRLLMTEIGFVPQAAMNSLDPVQRIDRQFHLAIREHRRVSAQESRQMAQSALEMVGISADRVESYPHQLSGGMRQRVLIALASVLEPDLLIADEPTTGLDVIVQDKVLAAMRRSKEERGHSLLLVTHDLDVAAQVCDRVIILERGQVKAQGTPTELRLASRREDDTVGPSSEEQARPALDVSGLSVAYSQGRGLAALRADAMTQILDEVDLSVAPGEILGVAGESGCGKSTLAAAIAGLADISSGSITINAPDGTFTSTAGRGTVPRQHLQMVFQDPYESLNPRSTVWQSVAEPVHAQGLGGADGPLGATVDDLVREALLAAELDPEHYGHRYPSQLSGGERQRVSIARALVVQPTVLVADEPVSMLDDTTAAAIVTLLRDLARSRGVAVVLITHSIHLLRDLCDRVAVLYLGRVVETGGARATFAHPRHPYTEALRDSAPDPHRPLDAMGRVRGEPPSMLSKPTGCAFHPRCPRRQDDCDDQRPVLADGVACLHPLELVGSRT